MKGQKAKFIEALRAFRRDGGEKMWDPIYERVGFCENRGDRVLADAMALWFADNAPGDELGINWFAHLHKYLVEAFDEFRTHERWQTARDAYAYACGGEEIPDLVNVHVGGLHRLLATHHLAYFCAAVSGEKWLREHLEAFFDAQQTCIDQAWWDFTRVAYRQIMPRIKVESHRGNKGKFGKTELLTWAGMGRVMFTFRRGKDEDDVQVTYVADDGDEHGRRAGPNNSRTPYEVCVEMIREVATGWSLDKMKRDGKIGMF